MDGLRRHEKRRTGYRAGLLSLNKDFFPNLGDTKIEADRERRSISRSWGRPGKLAIRAPDLHVLDASVTTVTAWIQ